MADTLALEPYIREQRGKRDILLMTHIVVGYPDFDTSLRLVETMVKAGVELMELQIPFSEPMADGPVIVKANQDALSAGATVEKCLEFCATVSRRFPIPFLIMTYTNLVYRKGIPTFVSRARASNIKGLIVPDLPPEESDEYVRACRDQNIDPIFIFAPTSSDVRLKEVARASSGFVYCVARKGVTGAQTNFSSELIGYLDRARAATDLPLAVGFGVTSKSDVDTLRGHADVAVIGSQSIRVLDEHGTEAVGEFLRGLRA